MIVDEENIKNLVLLRSLVHPKATRAIFPVRDGSFLTLPFSSPAPASRRDVAQYSTSNSLSITLDLKSFFLDIPQITLA